MRHIKILSSLTLFFITSICFAQTIIPNGFAKASLVLYNGSSLIGYVKENIKKSASVVFFNENTNKKTTYDGDKISSIQIADENFVCAGGDFFKIISSGKINFVQKQSNAADKATYNGNEAVFNNGTEGKIGDYFIYTNNKLKLINKKSIALFIETDLAGNTAAIEKAKTIDGDLSKLKDAINIYNNN
jgi:hypothetical protein